MTASIISPESVQTLEAFEQDALRTAAVLRERGVGLGERVMLKAGNSTAWLGTLLGLMHAGASIVLVDQREHVETTTRIAQRAGVKAVLVDDDAPIDPDLQPVTLTELLMATAGRPVHDRRLDIDAWGDLDDGLIMWTSGSTGAPKGAVKSGRKFLRNLERNADQVGHHSDDVLLPLLPFSHQYGLSMVLIAWLRRCSLVVAPYRRLDRSLLLAGISGSTVIDATPASYRSMLNIVHRNPKLRSCLDSVRMFCVGAAPLDSNLVDRYVAEFNLPLLDSYGSTELGNISFATLDNPVACGKAMEGIRLRVTDDDGREVAPGEAGEIEVDTPDAMEGHLSEGGALVPLPSGWQSTGDLGHLDQHGNLTVLGRKLAVHRMGYTLYPELIERKAAAAGCSVRVVALEDERLDARLVFVVEDEQERDPSYWWGRLTEALPQFERPNRVLVVGEFPLNRNGKPDKQQMAQLARADAKP
ncbi:class I adenylate-forming enzyme family protein [Micromonospora parathelypteridis]|uniref:Acyl-CoA synthetase (AMP-forming)/AMP-acid ligase II n=1 Tax=Micromonospora parathelypteridis TaxID=1839617 RepID=A0A840VJR6_9ACTN|nr:class I adenylate-forming enzyme family protein [Micromonospora parathelypteridis]MBB5476116.1 acyl-CoA synthetase (AMP-forming)/AMP-acid ligase II [Micromonospora parathelypteridis]GGO32773.1 malonyl-CoA synthase [Micromonospora parathelypteridis]